MKLNMYRMNFGIRVLRIEFRGFNRVFTLLTIEHFGSAIGNNNYAHYPAAIVISHRHSLSSRSS